MVKHNSPLTSDYVAFGLQCFHVAQLNPPARSPLIYKVPSITKRSTLIMYICTLDIPWPYKAPWNPYLSLSTGLFSPMNLCHPPCPTITVSWLLSSLPIHYSLTSTCPIFLLETEPTSHPHYLVFHSSEGRFNRYPSGCIDNWALSECRRTMKPSVGH